MSFFSRLRCAAGSERHAAVRGDSFSCRSISSRRVVQGGPAGESLECSSVVSTRGVKLFVEHTKALLLSPVGYMTTRATYRISLIVRPSSLPPRTVAVPNLLHARGCWQPTELSCCCLPWRISCEPSLGLCGVYVDLCASGHALSFTSCAVIPREVMT